MHKNRKSGTMCTREEINLLIRELLYHVEQVAISAARIEFNNEIKTNNIEYAAYGEKTNIERNEKAKKRYDQLVRFHSAYMQYFTFALDPFAEIIIPLTSSSLSLFITNIVSRMMPQQAQTMPHTSRTIVEFLQVWHWFEVKLCARTCC